MQTGPHKNEKKNETSGAPAVTAVTGVTGFIGRWLLTELTRHGLPVLAMMRRATQRKEELCAWVEEHGGQGGLIEVMELDLMEEDLALDGAGRERLQRVEVVYHLAALFGFGLSIEDAKRANMSASLDLMKICNEGTKLKRWIHISGYRTKGTPAQKLNIDDETNLLDYYKEHGAYETSKIEVHERIRRLAERRGIPLTRISPAIVIGDSQTGETTQMTGLVEILKLLWEDKLPISIGGQSTWMPLIPVDFLASLLAALPSDEGSIGKHYVVFDDRTPTLPQLLRLVAERMGARAPSRTLPVSLVRHLPEALTGVEREALSFISDDRYDPKPFHDLIQRLGLKVPPLEQSVERWVDHLLDTRFGERAARGGQNFHAAGVRVFARGCRKRAETVFLHGLFLNEHSWTPLTERLTSPFLALDLPGLGRSASGGGTLAQWTTAALSGLDSKPVVVGHSLGSAFALEYAIANPDRVSGVVLVSPFFLQQRVGWVLRQSWMTKWIFPRLGAARLSAILENPPEDIAVEALSLLRRSSVSCHSAKWLAWASELGVRERLRGLLSSLQVPALLIVGERDPLIVEVPGNVEVSVVEGAGHQPQLSHAGRVSELLETFSAFLPASGCAHEAEGCGEFVG